MVAELCGQFNWANYMASAISIRHLNKTILKREESINSSVNI
jgi:hypothetical protein